MVGRVEVPVLVLTNHLDEEAMRARLIKFKRPFVFVSSFPHILSLELSKSDFLPLMALLSFVDALDAVLVAAERKLVRLQEFFEDPLAVKKLIKD